MVGRHSPPYTQKPKHPFFAVLWIASLATSVQAKEPTFIPPVTPGSDEAVIYFYRDSLVSDLGGIASMYVNGIKVCDLGRSQYSHVAVAPGNYTITYRGSLRAGPPTLNSASRLSNAFARQLTIRVPLVAGKTYFVAYTFRSNLLAQESTWALKMVAETAALKDLSTCTYAAPVVEKLTTKLASPPAAHLRSDKGSAGVIPASAEVSPRRQSEPAGLSRLRDALRRRCGRSPTQPGPLDSRGTPGE